MLVKIKQMLSNTLRLNVWRLFELDYMINCNENEIDYRKIGHISKT